VVSRLRAACAALLGLTAGACAAVGPDYQVPREALANAPGAQTAFHGAADPAFTDQPPPPRWWRLYDDPRLDRLVAEALAANTDLRIAEANLQRSESLLGAARALREPDVAVGLGASETQRSAEAYVHPGPIPVRGLYDLGLAVSYDADLFGRLKRGVEAASARSEAFQAARDLARVNVAAATVRAYTEVCDAGAELAATNAMVRLQAQDARLVSRLAQGGRAIRVDAARQEAQEAQLRATLPALEARRTQALYRLATLAGRPPTAFDPGLADCRTPLQVKTPLPVGDGAALLRRRPDVREAERRLAAATAGIGVETAALYPNVQFGASIGSTGAVEDFGGSLTRRYSIGPTLSWRLNPSVARARIAGAEAQAKAELARFDGVVLEALRETESALVVYARDLDRQASLETARDRAHEAADAAHRLQAGGRIAGVAVLEADRALAAAELALAANRSQISTDQIAIFLTLGGGWER
jgi:NodT family efflux transporter outer membrane factor (OMF) lipoprotein